MNNATKKQSEPTHMVPCTGAAHSNPHIDNCGMCAPHWGEVEIPVRFATLAEYREARAEERARERAAAPGCAHRSVLTRHGAYCQFCGETLA